MSAAKRIFDMGCVLGFAPFWVPVCAIVALAVWGGLGRPIFFFDERAGLGGKAFRLVKFRTMREGAGSDAERMTRLGAFLRKTSLDELPELCNVLRGEMSLVGPRPLPVRYLPRYSAEQRHRHDVLPGITGWAQVNGRNALAWDEKFRYDLEYVAHHGLGVDLKILFLTAWQLVRPRGINHAGEATMSEFKGAEN